MIDISPFHPQSLLKCLFVGLVNKYNLWKLWLHNKKKISMFAKVCHFFVYLQPSSLSEHWVP